MSVQHAAVLTSDIRAEDAPDPEDPHYRGVLIRPLPLPENANQPPQKQSPPILRVPGEIRNRIYFFLFPTHQEYRLPARHKKPHEHNSQFPNPLSVRLTCRKLYFETNLLAFQKGTVIVAPSFRVLKDWLADRTPPELSAIVGIEMNIGINRKQDADKHNVISANDVAFRDLLPDCTDLTVHGIMVGFRPNRPEFVEEYEANFFLDFENYNMFRDYFRMLRRLNRGMVSFHVWSDSWGKAVENHGDIADRVVKKVICHRCTIGPDGFLDLPC
ncbi:unnamed protein product [Periconia digitata]|uniref:Uncharacterized protein n=1 Tax=Periconia digitata TaxID=1303443 RepID=A0A9W4U4P1_9PLEO|nr:unnamed protein product [Periconia digitata]